MDALVNSFISAANEDHSLTMREFGGDRLRERLTLRREEDNHFLRLVTLSLRRQRQRFKTVEDRLRLQNHAFPTTKGPIINGPVPIMGKSSQIVGSDVDSARPACTA